MSDSLKQQRDRFLAFAFASADLFLEIDAQGVVQFAIGASKSLTGQDIKSWIGKDWLSLFAPYEKNVLEGLKNTAKPGLRQGPALLDLNSDITDQKSIVTAIYMPDNPHFYVTLSFSDAMSKHLATLTQDAADRHIMDVPQFTVAAEEIALKAKAAGQNIQISVFDLDVDDDDRARFGQERFQEIMKELNTILMDGAIDGRTAAQINDNRYGVLQGEEADILSLQGKIEDFIKSHDPEGEGILITSKAVTSDLSKIEPKDIAKTIVYTVREFERNGTKMPIDDLNSGFVSYVEANSEKVEELRSFIQRSDFRINFQPIIHFQSREPAYYEMRCSFEQGNTQEWVMFGEDLGLSSAFDLAICERAISYINFKAGTNRTKFSVNISAKSFEDGTFYAKLKALLDENKEKNISQRLMFEITETPFISNIKRMDAYIQALSKDGFTVMLDDFEPNDHGMKQLKSLHAHGVKVDGKIIGKIDSSPTDMVALKQLIEYCMQENKTVTAKAVEDEKQINILQDIGITMGQGYAFGKPTDNPEYKSA